MESPTATKLTVFLEDDLEDGPADETVRFGIGGTAYEMDLTPRTPPLSVGSSPPAGPRP